MPWASDLSTGLQIASFQYTYVFIVDVRFVVDGGIFKKMFKTTAWEKYVRRRYGYVVITIMKL